MKKFGTLADAIDLAEFAHKNQFDKAGMPYIEHPKRVLAKVQAQGLMPYVQIAAILHDVTEDTAFTPEMLLELGFSEAAVEIIRLMDRDISSSAFDVVNQGRDIGGVVNGKPWYCALGGQGREDYYYDRIRENPGAYKVKEADIADNTEAWRLGYLTDETEKRLRKKYAHARRVLAYGSEAAAHREKFLYE